MLYFKCLAGSLCNELYKFFSDSPPAVSVVLSCIISTAKIRRLNLLAQKLVDSWPTSPVFWLPELLVPIEISFLSSCLCILINFSNPFLQGLFSQPEDTGFFFFFFLKTIMCLKELYYLYFVFLRTFLGFEFLQKSFSQSGHKFLINPPYNSIGGFFCAIAIPITDKVKEKNYQEHSVGWIFCHTCLCQACESFSDVSHKESYPWNTQSLFWEQSHGFHPLSPWVSSFPGFLMDVASSPGESLGLVLPTCFGWCSWRISMGCLPQSLCSSWEYILCICVLEMFDLFLGIIKDCLEYQKRLWTFEQCRGCCRLWQ